MTSKRSIVAVGAVLTVLASAACAKQEETPAAATPQQAQPQYQYPQTAQQQTTAYPQATQTTTTTEGTMATPNQFALSCQNDSGCGFGRCNLQYQKCAFPCQGPVDCAQGAVCNPALGVCLPQMQ